MFLGPAADPLDGGHRRPFLLCLFPHSSSHPHLRRSNKWKSTLGSDRVAKTPTATVMNPQSELESVFQLKPTLAPAWENTEWIPLRSNEEGKNEQKQLTEEWKATCWKYSANQEAWGERFLLFLFYIFLGPYGSVPVALKFLALDWLYCPWCLPHPHSSACTPHSVWPASRAPTTISASHTALATCRSMCRLSLQEHAQSEPAATTSVDKNWARAPGPNPSDTQRPC